MVSSPASARPICFAAGRPRRRRRRRSRRRPCQDASMTWAVSSTSSSPCASQIRRKASRSAHCPQRWVTTTAPCRRDQPRHESAVHQEGAVAHVGKARHRPENSAATTPKSTRGSQITSSLGPGSHSPSACTMVTVAAFRATPKRLPTSRANGTSKRAHAAPRAASPAARCPAPRADTLARPRRILVASRPLLRSPPRILCSPRAAPPRVPVPCPGRHSTARGLPETMAGLSPRAQAPPGSRGWRGCAGREEAA